MRRRSPQAPSTPNRRRRMRPKPPTRRCRQLRLRGRQDCRPRRSSGFRLAGRGCPSLERLDAREVEVIHSTRRADRVRGRLASPGNPDANGQRQRVIVTRRGPMFFATAAGWLSGSSSFAYDDAHSNHAQNPSSLSDADTAPSSAVRKPRTSPATDQSLAICRRSFAKSSRCLVRSSSRLRRACSCSYSILRRASSCRRRSASSRPRLKSCAADSIANTTRPR